MSNRHRQRDLIVCTESEIKLINWWRVAADRSEGGCRDHLIVKLSVRRNAVLLRREDGDEMNLKCTSFLCNLRCFLSLDRSVTYEKLAALLFFAFSLIRRLKMGFLSYRRWSASSKMMGKVKLMSLCEFAKKKFFLVFQSVSQLASFRFFLHFEAKCMIRFEFLVVLIQAYADLSARTWQYSCNGGGCKMIHARFHHHLKLARIFAFYFEMSYDMEEKWKRRRMLVFIFFIQSRNLAKDVISLHSICFPAINKKSKKRSAKIISFCAKSSVCDVCLSSYLDDIDSKKNVFFISTDERVDDLIFCVIFFSRFDYRLGSLCVVICDHNIMTTASFICRLLRIFAQENDININP